MEYVIDASVVAKWFLPLESGNKRVEELRTFHLAGEITLFVPELLFYEITNLLVTKKGISSGVVGASLDALVNVGLSVIPISHEIISSWIAIARTYHITAYDAIYVALAKQRGCIFITADKKLAKKLEKNIEIEIV